MEPQVLSVHQMDYLRSLGLDTSNGSAYHRLDSFANMESWIPMLCGYNDKIYNPTKQAFTLQDIIRILPEGIPEPAYDGYAEGCSVLKFNKKSVWYESWHFDDHKIIYFKKDSLLDAAYEMLIWCIQNNYIQVNKST